MENTRRRSSSHNHTHRSAIPQANGNSVRNDLRGNDFATQARLFLCSSFFHARLLNGSVYFVAFLITCWLAVRMDVITIQTIAGPMYSFYGPIFGAIILGGVSATIYSIPYALTILGFFQINNFDMRSPTPPPRIFSDLVRDVINDAAQTVRMGLVLGPIWVYLSGHAFDHNWHRAAFYASNGGQIAATILHFRLLSAWIPFILGRQSVRIIG